MWAAIIPNNVNIYDICSDKYSIIYDNIQWIEWVDSPIDFNKENIKLWRYTPEGIFIKNIDDNTNVNTDVNTNINDSKEMNIITAKLLIAATDWSVLPDVNLTEISKNNYINYRTFMRNIIINPIEGHIDWPALPVAEWTSV